MLHGGPAGASPGSQAGGGSVRALNIISLSDESDVGPGDAVLLTDMGRRRASGASTTSTERAENSVGVSQGILGPTNSEWLFIDEA